MGGHARTESSRQGALAALLVVAVLASPGCGKEDGPDPSDALFDPDAIVEVVIEMDPADWDELRLQTRDLFELLSGDCLADPLPEPSPYTYFPATVTVNGTVIEKVGVRKKGFIGSLSDTKPSLKIKFDVYVPEVTFMGMDRLTLNNNRQDPSHVRQCLAYQTFAAAGIPASRCSFAHVTVNGMDMGLFTNVESVKKKFLRRHFDDDEGNLYEGTLSDFRPEWVNTFEKKTNEDDPDRSDLDAVVTALDSPDADLRANLEEVIDFDEFLTFWVAEVLIAHWDGYAGNTNNFFVYNDPTTGRFTFMPWGTDGTLLANPFDGPDQLVSVFASGELARRLYVADETRPLYTDRLREVMDATWDEDALHLEVDRMEALITPVVEAHEGSARFLDGLVPIRDFIDTRRDEILAELDSGPPLWTDGPRDPLCLTDVGDIIASFDTTFGTIGAPDPFAAGTGTLDGTVETMAIASVAVGSTSGLEDQTDPGARVLITVVALQPDGTALIALVAAPQAAFFTGASFPVGLGTGVDGILLRWDPAIQDALPLGFLWEGSMSLDQASLTDGAAVSGTFEATVVDL